MINIEKLFKILNLGEIKYFEKVDSSQNEVFKVFTTKGKYLLKEYSKDAIGNKNDLFNKIKQISVGKYLNENKIFSILPISFNNNCFVNYNNKYYLIYVFLDYEIKNESDLTLENIRILSESLAQIHKLNINSDLVCQYKQINIDYDNYLSEFKNNDNLFDLYNILYMHIDVLKDLTIKCNNSINKVVNNLCISHNDFKLKNILWNEDKIYLIDFDACCLSNPIVSLAESSFSLSIQNNNINYDFYKNFLYTYFIVYGEPSTNFIDALDCAMNGKLQWLEYLLSKCDDQNMDRVEETIDMIKELVLFVNNKSIFISIYNEVKI